MTDDQRALVIVAVAGLSAVIVATAIAGMLGIILGARA